MAVICWTLSHWSWLIRNGVSIFTSSLSIFYKYLSKWRKNKGMEEQIYHYMLLILAVCNPKCSSLVPKRTSGNTARRNTFQPFQSDQSTGTTIIYNWPASSVDFRHKHSNCITWKRFPFNNSGIWLSKKYINLRLNGRQWQRH